MDKITGNSPEAKSLDITQQNIEQLKQLFPDVFSENKIDFEALKAVLGENIDDSEERYNFTWNGKTKARQIAQTPSTGTLRPCKEESVNWDTTENLFIEGDNLEVLKLLQKSYHKQVKMIYIDPPYNTGKDFVYKDNFHDNIQNYLELTGQLDDTGQKLSTNSDTSGRYHSDWLNMLYPRLKLARNLLSDDGAIFISIDDSEVDNLKKICDEIFGEDNYINTISVNLKNVAGASGGGEDKRLKKNIEYILVYSKDYSEIKPFKGVYNYTPISELVEEYRNEGKSWKYTSVLVSSGEKNYFSSTVDGDGNEIKIFERVGATIKSIGQIVREEGITEEEAYNKYATKIFQTQMPQSSIRPRVMDKVVSEGGSADIYSIEYVPRSGRNKGQVYEQFYKGSQFRLFAWLKDVATEIDGNLYKKDMQGTYWDFVSETKNLNKEGGISFPNGKKPIKLLSRMLEMLNSNDMLVLDFFAGSGSTAHAVMHQNSLDNGNRRFVVVQLPESIESNSDIGKLGYKTISDLSLQRIKNSGSSLAEQLEQGELDTGVKKYILDTTNIRPWDADFDNLEQVLQQATESIKVDRSSEDVLYEIFLKYGYDLTTPVETEVVNGKTVFVVGAGALIVCLDDEITGETVEGIAKLKEELDPETTQVVFKDAGFADSNVKTNAIQILKQAGIDDVKSI
ncbi:site-specific DNA-methyltransferase [Vibrio lentus]|uniref:site-specific DNA-methyltransferase n=1 Tax=Vibrio lentus TaxID=136468 RepID=UPI000C8250DC|nr:site-specific DNA-methyltransferase [Vibrio lentus]